MNEYPIGSKIRVTRAIYDYGDDSHHPPGYLAYTGNILIVREHLSDDRLAVSHEDVTDRAFVLFPGEYEAA